MPSSMHKSICPHLGVSSDPTIAASVPTKLHRCYLPSRVHAPAISHQEAYCLGSDHVNCSLYCVHEAKSLPSQSNPRRLVSKDGQILKTRVRHVVAFSVGAVLLLLLSAAAYLALSVTAVDRNQTVLGSAATRDAIALKPTVQTTSIVAVATLTPEMLVTPVPKTSRPETGTLDPNTDKDSVLQVSNVIPLSPSVRFMTPTPQPGGEVFQVKPSEGNAGWWSTNSTLRNHLGDSFLYAGSFGGQSYVAGIRFDLSEIPRGAPIVYAELQLTGLRDERLGTHVDGTWLVQLLPESSLVELGGSDFLTFYSAPAAITLFPQLHRVDLGKGVVNRWVLDQPIRDWLARQLLDGATSVTVRISAATQTGESLFAWDSGLGPETGSDPAILLLSVGKPPPTPPPLPTKPVIVATLTPIPANVMTVVSQDVTATAEAYAFGTRTPLPFQVVTPTPLPENLATVQAIALAEGLPPVLVDTPAPANEATAVHVAEYATAVALTTGTFTPEPEVYVTPVLIYPSPPPENVATAAARVIQATAAAASGAPSPTPLPRNAVMAVYAFATQTPSNLETAIAMVNEQNAAAATTGTPTPTPWNLVVITSVPQPTPTEIPPPTALPLVLAADVLTPTPTPTPTRLLTITDLEQFRGKILFLSDRSGSTQVWVMEPDSGQVLSLITDFQIMELAREQFLAYSPDRGEQTIVRADNRGDLQIHILAVEYGSTRQITHFRDNISYDPAWSPRGDQIAFVSTNSGNDEIYVVDTEGQFPQQLTFNTWEWDKHPSWSPDGSRIVFYSNREAGRMQLWIMNADGSGQRNLSSNEYNDWEPVWIR